MGADRSRVRPGLVVSLWGEWGGVRAVTSRSVDGSPLRRCEFELLHVIRESDVEGVPPVRDREGARELVVVDFHYDHRAESLGSEHEVSVRCDEEAGLGYGDVGECVGSHGGPAVHGAFTELVAAGALFVVVLDKVLALGAVGDEVIGQGTSPLRAPGLVLSRESTR